VTVTDWLPQYHFLGVSVLPGCWLIFFISFCQKTSFADNNVAGFLQAGCPSTQPTVSVQIRMLSESHSFLQIRNPTDFQRHFTLDSDFRLSFWKAFFIIHGTLPVKN